MDSKMQPNENSRKHELKILEKSDNIQCYDNNNRRENIVKNLLKLQKDNHKLHELNIKLEENCYNFNEEFRIQNAFVKQSNSDNLKIKNIQIKFHENIFETNKKQNKNAQKYNAVEEKRVKLSQFYNEQTDRFNMVVVAVKKMDKEVSHYEQMNKLLHNDFVDSTVKTEQISNKKAIIEEKAGICITKNKALEDNLSDSIEQNNILNIQLVNEIKDESDYGKTNALIMRKLSLETDRLTTLIKQTESELSSLHLDNDNLTNNINRSVEDQRLLRQDICNFNEKLKNIGNENRIKIDKLCNDKKLLENEIDNYNNENENINQDNETKKCELHGSIKKLEQINCEIQSSLAEINVLKAQINDQIDSIQECNNFYSDLEKQKNDIIETTISKEQFELVQNSVRTLEYQLKRKIAIPSHNHLLMQEKYRDKIEKRLQSSATAIIELSSSSESKIQKLNKNENQQNETIISDRNSSEFNFSLQSKTRKNNKNRLTQQTAIAEGANLTMEEKEQNLKICYHPYAITKL